MCATIANDNRTTIQPIVFETNKTGDTKRKKRYSGNPSSLSHTAPAELTDNELNKQKNKLLATEKIESGAKRVSHGMDADVEVKEPDKNASVNTEVSDSETTQKDDSPASDDKIKDRKKTLHLYAGSIGNANVSIVKFQSTKTPGRGAGILAGYQLTKSLSMESGMYYQKKFYYTDAKYYNPKKAYTSATRKLLYVEGNCSMLELPVNLKYNYKTSPKHTWFIVTGFSSYL